MVYGSITALGNDGDYVPVDTSQHIENLNRPQYCCHNSNFTMNHKGRGRKLTDLF